MADTSGLPPEGWYPDRPNATRLRHWNGTGWTNEFRPIAPTTAAPVSAPVAQAQPVRETTDARTRRELRAQVGSLVQGEPDTPAPGIVPMARQAEAPAAPAPAPAPVAEPEPVAAPEPIAAEPAPTLALAADPSAEFTAAERARVAAGYQPHRRPWQESFTGEIDLPTGNSQTFAGWLFAASPLWIGAMLIAGMTLLSIVHPLLVQGGLGLVAFAMTFLLARQDVRQLTEGGYRAPSLWWVLLPFLYFVVRMVRVGMRSAAMAVTYLLSAAALVALLYFAFIGNPLLLSLFSPPVDATSSAIPTPVVTLSAQERDNILTQAGTEAQVRLELGKTFEVGSVECVPFPSGDAGTTTTCVVELDGTMWNAGLELTPEEPSSAFFITGIIAAP